MRSISILAVLMAACGTKTDTETTDSGAGTDTDPGSCALELDSVFPTDGDTDAYYRTNVRFTLEEDLTGPAEIAVADASGAAVTGATTVAGAEVLWQGDALSPNTEYTATLTYDCLVETTTFTTSSTGQPTTADVIGRVYNLNLTEGNWVQPAGLGSVIASFIGDYEILVSPLNIDGTTIDMLAGVATGGEQNQCDPTIPFLDADYTDPYFILSAPALPLVVADVEVNISNLELSGAFAPDGSRLQGVVMKGKIDSRPLAIAFDFGNTDNAGCTALAAFGVQCEECDNGDGPYCITVNIEDLEAVEIDTTLVEIDQAAIDANPSCVGGA
jgi:Bacterial Ig-like domain